MLLALSGLVVLTLPGLASPDAIGSALMVVAGACWGFYSLMGRSGTDPLGRTATNFVRASVLAAPLLALSYPSFHVTAAGVGLAIASGSLASGVAYTLWYMAAAPGGWRAAIVRLIVPVLCARRGCSTNASRAVSSPRPRSSHAAERPCGRRHRGSSGFVPGRHTCVPCVDPRLSGG
jgi:threonine/homoserine efflux transporter RhtA